MISTRQKLEGTQEPQQDGRRTGGSASLTGGLPLGPSIAVALGTSCLGECESRAHRKTKTRVGKLTRKKKDHQVCLLWGAVVLFSAGFKQGETELVSSSLCSLSSCVPGFPREQPGASARREHKRKAVETKLINVFSISSRLPATNKMYAFKKSFIIL